MPGTPEATAYAIPTGTSIVVSTRPAIRSCGSQAASYRPRICSPGSQRLQPFMPPPLNGAHSHAAIWGGHSPQHRSARNSSTKKRLANHEPDPVCYRGCELPQAHVHSDRGDCRYWAPEALTSNIAVRSRDRVFALETF